MQVQGQGWRAQVPCLRAHSEVWLCHLVYRTLSASWLMVAGSDVTWAWLV